MEKIFGVFLLIVNHGLGSLWLRSRASLVLKNRIADFDVSAEKPSPLFHLGTRLKCAHAIDVHPARPDSHSRFSATYETPPRRGNWQTEHSVQRHDFLKLRCSENTRHRVTSCSIQQGGGCAEPRQQWSWCSGREPSYAFYRARAECFLVVRSRTWVTDYSKDMGNSLLGLKALPFHRSYRVRVFLDGAHSLGNGHLSGPLGAGGFLFSYVGMT
jgi:hypothetical protein